MVCSGYVTLGGWSRAKDRLEGVSEEGEARVSAWIAPGPGLAEEGGWMIQKIYHCYTVNVI